MFETACVRIYQHCRDFSTTLQSLTRKQDAGSLRDLSELADNVSISITRLQNTLQLSISILVRSRVLSKEFPDLKHFHTENDVVEMAPMVVQQVFAALTDGERDSIADCVVPYFRSKTEFELESEGRFDEVVPMMALFDDLHAQIIEGTLRDV